jgi:hypothetical protein
LWTPPRSAEDLLRRMEIYLQGVRTGGVALHCMGVDGLAASTVLAARVDSGTGHGLH